MTDIVERLRLFVPHCEDPNDYLEDELLFLQAADEIERLREALKQAGLYAWQGDTFKVMDIVRSTIMEKETV